MKLDQILILLALCLTQPVMGQFTDDFSDGNLDGWEGDVSNFIVNGNNQMQLNAPSGSTMSWIHTPLSFTDSMVWEFYLKLDFAPSTSNLLRIYLGLTSTDLSTASGYFLEIGAAGDTDPLELKYLNGGTAVSVAQSLPGLVAFQPVELSLGVVKKENGDWLIYDLGQVVPLLLFTAAHNLLPLSQLQQFGFYGKYTDTRRDKYYFDDINIHQLTPDVTAPSFLSLDVLDQTTVRLTFDEPIENGSANDFSNYTLTPGNANPNSIETSDNVITLHWLNPFVSQQPYTLQISGLKDNAGNVMSPAHPVFTYVQVDPAQPYDLLITEIMADPTPTVGLPDAEYLEIYNASNKILDLSMYTLTVTNTVRNLPGELIQPGEFVILCHSDFVASLSSLGRVIGLANMPTLTNSGTYLALKNLQGEVIHQLTYNTSWYKNPDKMNGGWSLEMINPSHLCAIESNWSASVHLSGGTPGKSNSQWQTSPDTEGPNLISLFIPDPNTLELRFDEALDLMLLDAHNNFVIDPAISVSSVSLINSTILRLHLDAPLEAGIIYSLYPFDGYDCLGNIRPVTDTTRFGLIVDALPGDVYINEVLFNPATGGVRFLEVINNSQKFINLNSLVIARLTATNQNFYPTGIAEILGPGEIAVFTPEPQDILSRYTVPNPAKLYTSSLPTWDDDQDNVTLLVNGEVIDSFTYSSDWHHPVLADQNGVSLERASVAIGTTVAGNWHSASSLSGYATPTGQNSQLVQGGVAAKTPFSITNRQFSPNDDGYKDYLVIQFDDEAGDDLASIWIYDAEGREIRELVSNESVGTSVLVTWDGRNEEGRLSEMGIYIVLVRLWNPDGNVSEYQTSCALVRR